MRKQIKQLTTSITVIGTALSIGFIGITKAQNLGISATGVVPNADAGLDINFTDKGLLIPRVNLTSLTTFNPPITSGGNTTSLLVYNTNATIGEGYYYWDGSRWVKLLVSGTPSDAWLTLGNGGTNSGIHFIGTTDNRSLRFRTNNVHRMVIDSLGNVGIGTSSPIHRLTINGGPPWTSVGWVGNVQMNNAGAIAWPKGSATDYAFGIGKTSSNNGFYFWRSSSDPGDVSNPPTYLMKIEYTTGNVGIGTVLPASRLDVRGRIRATFGVTTVLKDTTLNPANGDLGTQLAGILSIYDNVYARLPQNSSFTWNNQISLTSGQELVINGEGFTNGANNITATITMNSNGTFSDPSCNGGTPSKVVSRVKVRGGAKLTIQGVYIEETQDDTRPYSCAAEAGLISVYGADVGGHNLLGPSKAPAVVSIRQSRIKSTENIVNICGDNAFANINFAHVYIDRYSTRNIYAVSLFTGWTHPSCYAIVNNAVLTLGSGVTNQVDPRIYYSINNRLSIDPNTARIGINCNAPQHLLHVNGDLGVNGTIYASNTTISNAVSACSDLRFKEKINPLGRTLENIMKLEGVTYFWKYKEFPERGFNDKKQIGFIAQEVEKIYPEVIYTDEAGYKSIDYSRFTPILVEAIKEQQKMIEQQQSKIEQQQNKIEQQEKLIQNQQKALSELEKNIQNQQAEIKSLNEKLNNVINHLYAEKSMETKVGKKN